MPAHWNLPTTRLAQPSEAFTRVLSRRRVDESFLRGDIPGDVLRMAGGPAALARLTEAAWTGERVLVHGDFDVDGQTATALMVEALHGAGADAVAYIPQPGDGYGLSLAGIHHAQDTGASLVVTVDCGIAALEAALAAQSLGLDLVVTDHHPPPDGKLPDAAALLDPKLAGCGYGQPDLAGVGVAYALARGLVGSEAENWLDLVALGTVADVVPLRGENRTLVQRGLEAFREGYARPGLRALCAATRVDPREISAADIAYGLAPALNAARRLGDPQLAYRLLTSQSDDEAQPLAAELWALNTRRKRLTTAAMERARFLVDPRDPVLVVVDPQLHSGLAGLIAGKLGGEYNRPAIVLTQDGDRCLGSARGTADQDIRGALASCADLLEKWGGHARAAGLSLKAGNVWPLRERLAQLVPPPARQVLDVDLLATLDLATDDLYEQVQRCEPCGSGWPPVVIASPGVLLDNVRTSRDGQHLFGTLISETYLLPAVGWGLGSVEIPFCADVAYKLEKRNGQLTASLLDVVPAGEGIPAGWGATAC